MDFISQLSSVSLRPYTDCTFEPYTDYLLNYWHSPVLTLIEPEVAECFPVVSGEGGNGNQGENYPGNGGIKCNYIEYKVHITGPYFGSHRKRKPASGY
jgi:hypothetical protein